MTSRELRDLLIKAYLAAIIDWSGAPESRRNAETALGYAESVAEKLLEKKE